MSWTEVTNLQPDLLRGAQEWAFEVYLWFFKDKKLRREVAIEQTSLALGLSHRKARSLLGLDGGVAIRPTEYEALRSAFLQHLVERERELISRSEAAKKRRADIQHQEGLECSGQLSLNFSNGDGTRHSGASIDTKRHISTRNVAR